MACLVTRLIQDLGFAAFVVTSILSHVSLGPAPSPALAALPAGLARVTMSLRPIFGLAALLVVPFAVTGLSGRDELT